MTEKNEAPVEEGVEVQQEQLDELTEKAQALAQMHERLLLHTLSTAMKTKFEQIVKGQKNGSVKKNVFNKGYLQALSDVIYTFDVLLYMSSNNNEEKTEGEETNEPEQRDE